jgi:hypothetical protein
VKQAATAFASSLFAASKYLAMGVGSLTVMAASSGFLVEMRLHFQNGKNRQESRVLTHG